MNNAVLFVEKSALARRRQEDNYGEFMPIIINGD
jgi:hypothetical protein